METTISISNGKSKRDESVLQNARTTRLDARECGLPYWIRQVAQTDWLGFENGHRASTRVPEHMLREGPFRTAMLKELAFRALSEERGTRAITHLVRTAPTAELMDFFATQLLDEARHGAAFRGHLVALGIAPERVDEAIEELAGQSLRSVLMPMEEFALREQGGQDDFIIGVTMLTVVLEGVLAPASEMSELKWKVLDPAAAEIARGANQDELRHLCVGASIVKAHLREHPEDRERIAAAAQAGMAFWQRVPILDVIVERELLFQDGIREQRELLGDYELVPGRLLAETSAEERLSLQVNWSQDLQRERAAFMGLT
jgi:hypothetical protein